MPAWPGPGPRRWPGRSAWSASTPSPGCPTCAVRWPRWTSCAPKVPTSASPRRTDPEPGSVVEFGVQPEAGLVQMPVHRPLGLVRVTGPDRRDDRGVGGDDLLDRT